MERKDREMSNMKVTEGKYIVIKTLLKGGMKRKDVAREVHLNERTVGYVKASEDYEDYKEKIKTRSGTYSKRKREQKEVNVSGRQISMEEPDGLPATARQNAIDALDRIAVILLRAGREIQEQLDRIR